MKQVEIPATNRLVLGTVQLGLPYGIANKDGHPNQMEANSLVRMAWDRGVRFFDTAQGYGISEAVLGAALASCPSSNSARLMTKLPPQLTVDDAPHMELTFCASLSRLKAASLYALFFHREEHLSLLEGPIGKKLSVLQQQGRFEFFGVSVYSPEAALAALEHPFISLVQIPASLFDRRFEDAGVFSLAERMGKQIHVRSVLLQGLLCMAPSDLPDSLSELRPTLAAFRELCDTCGLEPAPLALAWMLRRHDKAFVLFGAESSGQVTDNLDFQNRSGTIPLKVWDFLDGLCPPQKAELLNPSLWK